MQFLNNIDIITIVAYVVVLILIGVALSRVASGGLEDYFWGDGACPGICWGASG
ncbi:MAG: hypothetical protein HC901_01735, partial [Bdellovibrionaceae bacterium]|nr:hypothetical protein [Pseudobdellovibrionaceae bacterium]